MTKHTITGVLLLLFLSASFGIWFTFSQKSISPMIQHHETISEQTQPHTHQIVTIQSAQELESLLKTHTHKAVIFYHMDHCMWCVKAQPVYEQLAQRDEYKDIQFYEVDGIACHGVETTKNLYNQSITGFPTFILINEQGFFDKQVGFKEQDLQDKLIKLASIE